MLPRVGAQFPRVLPDGDGVQIDDAEDALERRPAAAPSCGWRRDSCRGGGCRWAECPKRCGSCAHGGVLRWRGLSPAAGRRSSDGLLPSQQRLQLAQLGRPRKGERACRIRRGRRRSTERAPPPVPTNEPANQGASTALRARRETAIAPVASDRPRQPPLQAARPAWRKPRRRSTTASSMALIQLASEAASAMPTWRSGSISSRRENDVDDRAERRRSSPASACPRAHSSPASAT